MKVYLAGGMYSGWQDALPTIAGVQYVDPRKLVSDNNAITTSKFVTLELEAVRTSDLLFCYIESHNPSGIGATWECAVASENKVPIITVWERPLVDPFFASHSLYLYSDFKAGMDKLVKYCTRNEFLNASI